MRSYQRGGTYRTTNYNKGWHKTVKEQNNYPTQNDIDAIILEKNKEIEKLKAETKELNTIIRSKDREIAALKKKVTLFENKVEFLQKDNNTYKNKIATLKEAPKQTSKATPQYYNRYNNNNNNDIQFQRDHELAKKLQRELNSQLNDDNYIPHELIDPVQEVERAIINELYPNPDQMTYEQLLSLENEIGKVNTGLSKKELSLLKTTEYSDIFFKDQQQCIICQEEFNDGEKIKKLSCNHIYHCECIDEWLMKERKCPCCNKEIPRHK